MSYIAWSSLQLSHPKIDLVILKHMLRRQLLMYDYENFQNYITRLLIKLETDSNG